MPSLFQVCGCNLCQFTFSERNKVAITPKLGAGIRAFVRLAHQLLVRYMLVKLSEYVGATSVVEAAGLLVNLFLKLGRTLVDVHDLGSVLGGLVVGHLIFSHLAP